MCGITGAFSATDEFDCSRFHEAHSRIKHRGPDDEGFVALVDGKPCHFSGTDTVDEFQSRPDIRTLSSSRVVLGHRRLSILDLSARGHQPLGHSSGRYFIVFNGEVFNYLEIRRELLNLGHEFCGDSDTEVALHAYIEWGDDAFARFNGMWAIAIWDVLANRLILSRDRFGIKPLYYTEHRGVVCFASETKFLTAFLDKRWNLNDAACADYLYRMHVNHDGDTLLQGIHEVAPAHVVSYGREGWSSKTYWQLTPRHEKVTLEEAVQEMGRIFRDSLSLRMRSDVEVGSLLSGGLDSSLIVCALHELGFVASDQELKTFSAVFEDQRFSEKRYVDAVAEAVPIKTTFVWPEAEEVRSYLDRLLYHIEDPFRSLSQLLQYRLYEEINSGSSVKVLLNGQGGDELFGGYTNHYYMHFASLWARRHYLSLASEAAAFKRERGYSWKAITRQTKRFLSQARASDSYFNQVTYAEVTHTPLPEYLKYDDRTSMAFGLEARPPFLDHRLLEFAFSLPENLKIRGLVNKRVERVYAQSLVPSAVVMRTDKMGFVSPQEVWQREELREDLQLLTSDLGDIVRFGSAVERDRAIAGYKAYMNHDSENWMLAWRVYCMQRWLNLNSGLLA